MLFYLVRGSVFQNTETYKKNGGDNELTYGNSTIQDLVNKDTDGDGILDWKESLYGLDPTKKETTPGVPDSLAIEKIKIKQGTTVATSNNIIATEPENLSETEKFSRELFATITAASQNGAMDQASIEALGSSLADYIQNSLPKKTFTVFDIKISNDDTADAFTTYNNVLTDIFKKNSTVGYTIMDVLQKFAGDGENIDASVLIKLDPIITQTKKIMDGMIKTTVPQSVSRLHLNVINSLEKLIENLSNIKLFESDTILALSGISKYQKDVTELEDNIKILADAIRVKIE